MSTTITHIHGREVLDSRGKPTVEVEVWCGEHRGRAIVPSGASTGQFEAHELRDGDLSRLNGQGVLRAVAHVNEEIRAAVVGLDAADQVAIDGRLIQLDGTANKSRLGANAVLGVSLAVAYAAAIAKRVLLASHLRDVWREQHGGSVAPYQIPLPMVNMISGGLHAGGNLDFQDFLILPVGAKHYRQALEWIVTVYWKLGKVLSRQGYEGVLVGDEGGYGPRLKTLDEAAAIIQDAIVESGLRPGEDVALGLDVASTHFHGNEGYRLRATGERILSSTDLVELLADWCEKYPIVSIEDGLAESDWEGWQVLTKRLGSRVQLIGDDLFVTNTDRLQMGIERGVANSILIKFNQIGTLTETLSALKRARDAGYATIVSARSGETEDATIADLAVATGAGQLKVGSVARSERLAKYNQLLRLEEELGEEAIFAGAGVLGRCRG